jgi:hypothetical protein
MRYDWQFLGWVFENRPLCIIENITQTKPNKLINIDNLCGPNIYKEFT